MGKDPQAEPPRCIPQQTSLGAWMASARSRSGSAATQGDAGKFRAEAGSLEGLVAFCFEGVLKNEGPHFRGLR